jgi:hypothetical protein
MITLVNLKKLRFVTLLFGILVSWTATIKAFINFYNIEGTIFKIKDCLIPNPVVTPCFWGSLAFFLAAIWAYKLKNKESLRKENYFLYFMAGSFVFAWSNFVIELIGVTPKPGSIIAPCPATTSSPFTGACFFGSILFTFSLILTYWAIIVSRNSNRRQTA